MNNSLSLKNEVLRKLIHMSFIWVPILYTILSKTYMLSILFPITFIFLTIDRYRYIFPPLKKIFEKYFNKIMREHETQQGQFRLTGASMLMLSSAVTIAFFEKQTAIIAISVLLISDSCAAIYGMYKTGDNNKKSLAGFCAYLISAIFVTCLICKGFGLLNSKFFYASIIACGISAFVELYSKKFIIDDNLAICLTIGLVVTFIETYF